MSLREEPVTMQEPSLICKTSSNEYSSIHLFIHPSIHSFIHSFIQSVQVHDGLSSLSTEFISQLKLTEKRPAVRLGGENMRRMHSDALRRILRRIFQWKVTAVSHLNCREIRRCRGRRRRRRRQKRGRLDRG